MRILVLALAATGLMGTAAASAQSFEGPYLGITAGYSSTTAEATYAAPGLVFAGDEDESGAVGGVFAGYGGVNGRIFGTLEGQALMGRTEGSISGNGATVTVEQNETLSLVGRAGYQIHDSVVAYGIAGWAWTNFEATATGGGASAREDGWFSGPRAGLGLEFVTIEKAVARADYTHTWYEANTYSAGAALLDLEGEEDTFLVGVGLRF